MRENRRSAEEPLGFGIRKREVQGLCIVPDMLFGGRGNNGEEIHRLLQKPGETDLGNRAVLLLCELFRPGETGTVDGGVILQNGALAQHISDMTGQYLAGYSNEAGFSNWCVRVKNIPSVTVETGTVPAPLPLSQFAELWEEHRLIFPMLACSY